MMVVGGDVAKANFKGTRGSGGERARFATLRIMGGRVGSPWPGASPSRSLPPGKVNFSGLRDLSGTALAPGETVCTKERRSLQAIAQSQIMGREGIGVLPLPNFTHLLGGQTQRFIHANSRPPCGVGTPCGGVHPKTLQQSTGETSNAGGIQCSKRWP